MYWDDFVKVLPLLRVTVLTNGVYHVFSIYSRFLPWIHKLLVGGQQSSIVGRNASSRNVTFGRTTQTKVAQAAFPRLLHALG